MNLNFTQWQFHAGVWEGGAQAHDRAEEGANEPPDCSRLLHNKQHAFRNRK